MRYLVLLSMLACGGSPPAIVEVLPEEPAEQAPVAAPEAQPEPSVLARLVASIEETPDAPSTAEPTFAGALAACPRVDMDSDCILASFAGFEPSSSRWIVFDVHSGENGPERAWLGSVAVDAEESTFNGSIEGRGLATLSRAIRRYRTIAVRPSLVRGAASVEHSISEYTPLVLLRAPLEGWMLYLETNTNLDGPQHTISLVRRDLGETIELARRPAPLDSCDGDGWTCDAVEDGDCTAAQLRAEGRLCVQPFSIGRVALSPDRATLFVGGTAVVAGHGGYPAFHMVLPLPDRAREVMASE